MTIHVNIGEAKTRLSELIAASVRGEAVIIDKDGTPQVQLVALESAQQQSLAAIAAKRQAAFGALKAKLAQSAAPDIPESMTADEVEQRFQRKFAPPAA